MTKPRPFSLMRSISAGAMAAFALVLLADVLAPGTLRRPDALRASQPVPYALPD